MTTEKQLTQAAKDYSKRSATVFSGKPDWNLINISWQVLRDCFRDASCEVTAQWNGFDDFLACNDCVSIRELRAES